MIPENFNIDLSTLKWNFKPLDEWNSTSTNPLSNWFNPKVDYAMFQIYPGLCDLLHEFKVDRTDDSCKLYLKSRRFPEENNNIAVIKYEHDGTCDRAAAIRFRESIAREIEIEMVLGVMDE